jgi:hypothetical protein
MSKTKEVAEKKETALAVMNMFEADAVKMKEDLDQDDLALPFLKILAGNSEFLNDHETARGGDILNSITMEVYKGKEGIRVIPCAYQRRFLEWSQRGSDGQDKKPPKAIYTPAQPRPKTERCKEDNIDYVLDEDGRYVPGQSDYIQEVAQHFVLLLNSDGTYQPALISLKSTGLKISRKWNSMVQTRSMVNSNGVPFNPPRFSHIYHLKTVADSNAKGSWHQWEISLEGVVDDASLYGAARSFAEGINKGEVVVRHTEEDSNGPAPTQNVNVVNAEVVSEGENEDIPW